jgi:hypothetical protein
MHGTAYHSISSALRTLSLLLAVALLASCAGKKTKNLTPAELAGKVVVLAEVKGPKDLRTIVEVGIVNEIIEKRSF